MNAKEIKDAVLFWQECEPQDREEILNHIREVMKKYKERKQNGKSNDRTNNNEKENSNLDKQ
jgi:activator of HSP90 ATPase